MNRGRNKQNIFLADEDKMLFQRLLAEGLAKFDTELHAYCLMNNHYHLLLSNPGSDLPSFMQWFSSKYVSKFNQIHDFEGALFKDRYKSIVIDTDAYLMAATRYIHRNPLAFLTPAKLSEYEYSSLQTYFGLADKRWVSTAIIEALVTDPSDLANGSSDLDLYDFDKLQMQIDLVLHLETTEPPVSISLKVANNLIFLLDPNHSRFDGLPPPTRQRKLKTAQKTLSSHYSSLELSSITNRTLTWLGQKRQKGSDPFLQE